MDNQRFYKRERLCSKIDIDRLFPVGAAGGRHCRVGEDELVVRSVMAYPWRAVWTVSGRVDFPRLLIVVPKRRLRHAVDRATMRRRLREAYRCNRTGLVCGAGGVDVGLIYVADKLTSVGQAHASLRKVFNKIRLSVAPTETHNDVEADASVGD